MTKQLWQTIERFFVLIRDLRDLEISRCAAWRIIHEEVA